VKRFSVQVKIGLLMILAVGLLAATGYLAWVNLSSIVGSIRTDVGPGQKLLSIREISMDLQKAENSFRMYSVTDNEKDLEPYYSVISEIDGKVNRLREECSDSPVLLAQTDTISKLIEENIYIWNELLYLNQNNRVIEYLMQLPDRLNLTAEAGKESEKGILKRVFSRSEKSRIDEQALITDLDSLEKADQAVREKMRLRESQLASTSTRIKEQFHDLTAKMESEVAEILKANKDEADLLAGRTFSWLVMFLVSGILLAVLVVFIVARYVRKSDAYQVALQRSKDEAENLARTKEQFMANMSHEIRTPVTAISGFTEQLLREPLDENTSRTLKIIRSSSRHLEKIINDILDFSKLEDGKVVLEQVHFGIREVVNEVCALFDDQARKNNTFLSCSVDRDTPPVLLGDPYRLKQIMINLISNSVKFTVDGTVHISVRSIRKEHPALVLVMEFADTGIGIDEDKIDTIFDDFTQEETSTTRKYGGTGLGLSIVRKLVDLQQGKIECKSRKNQGTTITCEIPFLEGDSALVSPESGLPVVVPEEIRKLGVLVVDDELYNRMLFRSIFTRWGLEYAEARDGLEALEILRSRRFDLLFMDLRMPEMDGAKATEVIRNELNISGSDMPVICVTAALPGDDLQNYRKAGMNAFLRKPFTEEALLKAMLEVTGHVRESAAAASPEEEIRFQVEGFAPNTGAAPEVKAEENNPGHIDLRDLRRTAGGDEQFVREMLVTFMEGTGKGLGQMAEHLETGDMPGIADIAHKLIPQCRHLGAVDLTSLLTEVETASKSGSDSGKIEFLLSRIGEIYPGVRREIEEQMSKIG
jgi:signal transduction histidine kinase/CheY-like chemotaxis protein/HPt (histidine-containing phosphotransfer) domain-containing protein